MLTIKREKNKVDETIPYQILINGINMGMIENGELKNLDLKNGSYKLQVKSSKMESQMVEFSITDGSFVEFLVKPAWRGNSIFHLLKRKKGILLELKQDIYL